MSAIVPSSISELMQQELLEALLNSDARNFKRLLQHPAVDPTYKYGKPHYGTCVEIVCRHPEVNPDILKELLMKVKPNINNLKPEPLHYAAGKGNVQALALLVKNKRTRINIQDSSGCTALHHLVMKFPDDAESKKYVECLKLLLQHPLINVNIPNERGYTPIHQAVSSPGEKAAVLAFLECSRGLVLDLDSFSGHGRTARQSILLKFPELYDVLPSSLTRHSGLNEHLRFQGEET